jgi:hypothetical protein
MIIDLKNYQTRAFSQFGQDGVLQKIFEKIAPVNKQFVEFGSSANDEGMGNTAYLRRFGWNGLLMNDTDKPYGVDIINKKYDLKVETVTAENINELFKKYDVSELLGFLSIDVDGNDYWIWKALSDIYKPAVICIEANTYIPFERNIVQKYDIAWRWKGDAQFGSSVKALYDLGVSKGYSLIACCVSDLIFIRNELMPRFVEFKDMNNVEKLMENIPELDALKENAVKEINAFDGWVQL